MKTAISLACLAMLSFSASVSAFWGNPGWGPNYNNAYSRGWGGLGGDQFRGGDASGGGDFSMSFSGRANSNLRGYGSGYGAGDGWGRGYGHRTPFYGVHGPYTYHPPAPAGRGAHSPPSSQGGE